MARPGRNRKPKGQQTMKRLSQQQLRAKISAQRKRARYARIGRNPDMEQIRRMKRDKRKGLIKHTQKKPIENYLLYLMFEAGIHPKDIQAMGLVNKAQWNQFAIKNRELVNDIGWRRELARKGRKPIEERINIENGVQKMKISNNFFVVAEQTPRGWRALWIENPKNKSKKVRPITKKDKNKINQILGEKGSRRRLIWPVEEALDRLKPAA